MSFKFPFTNYHELNLTWVLDQLKKLFEESAENVSTIQNYDGRLTAVETELPVVSENASEASRAAAAAGTLAQTAKATADIAQENAVQAQGLAGTARQEAQAAQTAANEATQAAQQAQATAQNFDGRITQAENDAAAALEASRSFENRVQAAINTANNAAQTATNAQGIATNANQNAAAALDKIGDLSELDTENKNSIVSAVNEINSKCDAKLDAPEITGTVGQILTLNSDLKPIWDSVAIRETDSFNYQLFKMLHQYDDITLTSSLKTFTWRGCNLEITGTGSGGAYVNANITGSVFRLRSGTKGEFAVYDTDFVPCALVLADGARIDAPFYCPRSICFSRYMTKIPTTASNIGNLYIFFRDSQGNVDRTLAGRTNIANTMWNLSELCKNHYEFAIFVSKETSSPSRNLAMMFNVSMYPFTYTETNASALALALENN